MSTGKKERNMRNIKLSMVVAAAIAVALASAAPGHAANNNWVPQVDGTYLWADAANWDPNIPTDDGGQVAYLEAGGKTITVDLDGNDVNLGSSKVRVHHGNWIFDDLTTVDMASKARLTVDNLYADNCSGNPIYNIRITANQMTTDHNPNQVVTLNAPFTIGHIKKGWPGSQGREI